MWIARGMGAVCTLIGLSLLILMTMDFGIEVVPDSEMVTLLGIVLVVLGLYLVNRRRIQRVE